MKRSALIGIVVLLCCMCAMPCLADNEEAAVRLVKKAAATFSEKSTDYTLKLLNTMGTFREGPVYVFAVSFDGMVLAHPANRKLVGKKLLDFKDTKGKEFVKEFTAVAKDPGAGWVEYSWRRHGEKEGTLKRTYIMRVPGKDFYVGAGYYVE